MKSSTKSGQDERNEFLSVASHELKMPLTALKLQVQMAKKKIDTEGINSLPPLKVQHLIERANQDLLRLTRLVDDMLDVSRINTGKFSLHFEYFNLNEFLEDFLERYATSHPNFKELVTTKIAAPTLVCWDRYRIEQVLTNLLSNAFRYGNGAPIEIYATHGGGMAYIGIKDFGPGIPVRCQKKIFQRYEKGVFNRECGGLGLGLYIANKIVEGHGGGIHLVSRVRKGSLFEVRLPLRLES